MGTTSSAPTSNGNGIINLSRGTKVQAYLANPQKVSATVGILVICDTQSSFFDAPEMRRVVDYMCLASSAMVMSVDMVMSPTNPAATNLEKVEVLSETVKHKIRHSSSISFVSHLSFKRKYSSIP
jgi:hypothetical protein